MGEGFTSLSFYFFLFLFIHCHGCLSFLLCVGWLLGNLFGPFVLFSFVFPFKLGSIGWLVSRSAARAGFVLSLWFGEGFGIYKVPVYYYHYYYTYYTYYAYYNYRVTVLHMISTVLRDSEMHTKELGGEVGRGAEE